MSQPISTVKELIANGAISDVRFLRMNAELRDEPDESFSDDDVHQSMQLNFRSLEDTIEFRLVSRVQTRHCEYEVIAATQVAAPGFEIDDAIAEEFTSRIGFTVVYPYIREAIQTASARLRVENVVIPLVDPESVSLTPLAETQ